MIFRELIKYCKVRAIADALSPDEEAMWRSACREYSQNFNTPLLEVYKLDPEHVLLNNFEKQLDSIDFEENLESVERVLEQVYRIENPDYDKAQEKELQQFITHVEKNYVGKEKVKKSLLKKEVNKEENKPVGGSIDFSNIKDEES